MKEQICFLIGHRECDDTWQPALQMTVEKHITEYGVFNFLVGHYGGFDQLAAQSVIRAKVRYPQVRLWLLLPYHPAERPMVLPAGFDGFVYPLGMETVPRRLSILRANRYAVERSDWLIAGIWHPASNAAKVVDYAQRRGGIHITLLKP